MTAKMKAKKLFDYAKNNYRIDMYLSVPDDVALETCIQIANNVIETLVQIQNETSNNVSKQLEFWIMVKDELNTL